ncbi:MAG: hypothetical protein QNL04_14875, partial [SAR324 cluster bacterium]|nr:hypothetical protein [SAR324 cluster bacterium]
SVAIKKIQVARIPFIISVFALCSVSNSLYLQEIFRMQNGLSIGLGAVIYFVQHGFFNTKIKAFFANSNLPGMFIAFCIGALLFGFYFQHSDTNYFPAKAETLKDYKAPESNHIPLFKGQIWSSEINTFYRRYRAIVTKTIKKCKKQGIRLEYFSNISNNAFYTVLTPLTRLHLTPWVSRGPVNLIVQPDFRELKNQYVHEDKLLILSHRAIVMEEGYKLLKPMASPAGQNYSAQGILRIYGPEECVNSL